MSTTAFRNAVNASETAVESVSLYRPRMEAETGLYYYRARYYDPEIGRFVSEDPVRFKGGFNLYAYVTNSAPNFSDPTGQFKQTWHRDQTYRLAKDVFGPKCEDKARAVADADAAVDDFWGLLNPFGSAWQYGGAHFPAPDYADALVYSAINTCDPSRFGRALHTLQDGYAHPSGPLGPLVHVITGTLYDYAGGASGLAALGATRTALQDFKDKCLKCCTGGSETQLIAH